MHWFRGISLLVIFCFSLSSTGQKTNPSSASNEKTAPANDLAVSVARMARIGGAGAR